MKKTQRNGFTLIELMGVVVIILILLGFTFKIGGSVGKKIRIADTAKKMEHLKMCIEEYYVKFGRYPPVTDADGEACSWINGNERFGMEDEYGAVASAYAESGDSFNQHPNTLPAYLTTAGWLTDVMTDGEIGEYRNQTGWGSYWPSEDEEATNETGAVIEDDHASVGHFIFSNRVYTIKDAWGGLFQYDASEPDFQSYRLWSNGPDGAEGTADDVGHDSFVN